VLEFAGVSAATLAETYGTPLVVIDLEVVDAAIDAFVHACAPHGVEISYAAKAFVSIGFARHLLARGLGLDVCSTGELLIAQRAGYAPSGLTLHGAGKTDDDLRAAAQGLVGRIAVDGIDELRRLAAAARAQRVDVLLRLNSGVEARTHAFVRTGGDDTKFGIHPRDEADAAAIIAAHPHLRFAGLHAHMGSQIYDSQAFAGHAEALVDAAARFAGYGLMSEQAVVGGGFGVATQRGADERPLDLDETIATLVRRTAQRAQALGIPVPRIGIEPGRAIVAAAGTTLYRVQALKRQTTRTFVVVDGGMTDNPRPAIYGARHHVASVRRPGAADIDVTISGRSCENDELGPARLPHDLQAGDLLAMETTGAYTFSMASNYNRFPRPAVVAVEGGKHRLFIRRETLDDVIRTDADG
jgi:diaminopimelate decarboxylase